MRAFDRSGWQAVVTPFEGGEPVSGRVDCVDHSVGAQTGTLRVRARLPNRDRRMLPASVVRVAFRYGIAERATLIPELAIGTDQGQSYVLVANADGIIGRRSIEPGPRVRAWRVVTNTGVHPGEQVVLPGSPGVRPGLTVTPAPEVLR